MSSRRESLLWGLVGALSFLVLAQGYRLLYGEGPTLPALLAVALVVWVAGSVGTWWLGAWLDRKRRV
ncbi:MAG: hypothetical protein ACOCSF_08120 [Halanaeroarchaeum sp.]